MISNVIIVLYSIAANRGAVVADAGDKEMRTANRHMGKKNAAQRSLGRSESAQLRGEMLEESATGEGARYSVTIKRDLV